MKEMPPIMKGLDVRDGWDRKQSVNMYFVRSEHDPIADIRTEWQKPAGPLGFFRRIDTTTNRNQEVSRVISLDALTQDRIYRLRRKSGEISEDLQIGRAYGTGDELELRVEIDEGDEAEAEVVVEWQGDKLDIYIQRKEVALPYELRLAYVQSRSIRENVDFIQLEHNANLAKYPPLTAVGVTLFPVAAAAADLDKPEFDAKNFVKEMLMGAKASHKMGGDLPKPSDFDLDPVGNEVTAFTKQFVDMILEPNADDDQRALILYGMSNLINIELPDHYDLTDNPEEKMRMLKKAARSVIVDMVIDGASATEESGEFSLDFQLNPHDAKVRLGTSVGILFKPLSESDYEIGQPHRYEDVTYVVEDTSNGVVLSYTPRSGKTFQVQVPRRIEVEEVRSQILSQDNGWITLFDRLRIKSEQIKSI